MSRRRKAAESAPLVAGQRLRGRDALVALALFAVTAALFAPALRFDFIDYDDNHYVTHNPYVHQGLTGASLRQFFTAPMVANYHPLTMASHALDFQLYQLDAKGHHRTSVLLHAANAALLFLWLRIATGRVWTAALAAALFAFHPLRVESVVWVAERKDVLSGFFGLLALVPYTFYARRRGLWAYAATLLLLACGLLAKPMLVTFPFVLLLLDFWPYERWKPQDDWRGVWPLVIEKLPLLALVAVFSGVTLWVQGAAGAMRQEEIFPIHHRLLNAVLSYGAYVGQTVWPWPLTVLYPLQGKELNLWQAAIMLGGLTAVTAWTFLAARRQPYLPVGWLWFLGTLVPVIGLVQVGEQAHADRYTYWPHIGLFLAVAWLIGDIVESWPARWRAFAAAACLAILAALGAVTVAQEQYWRDSETLFRHTIAHTRNNYIAHLNLGNGLIEQAKLAAAKNDAKVSREKLAEAETVLQSGLEIQPSYFKLNRNLGQVYMLQGRYADAARQFEKALERSPDDASVHYALGEMLSRLKRYDAAAAHYRAALDREPRLLDAQVGWAAALAEQGRTAAALTHARAAGNHPLGAAIAAKALGAAPRPADRQPDQALALARQAALATRNADPRALDALGIALGAKGQFDGAAQITRRAIELSDQQTTHDIDWPGLSAEMRARLKLYEAQQPYVLPEPAN